MQALYIAVRYTPKIKRISGTVAFSILLFAIIFSAYFPNAVGDNSLNSEFLLELNPISMQSNIPSEDFKFETEYLSTYSYKNSQNSNISITIPEEIMGEVTGNSAIREPKAWDNLGNHFAIIEKDGKYILEKAIISIPSNFEHIFHISWARDNDVSFNENTSEFYLRSNISPAPDKFVIRLPSSYTVLGTFPVADQENTNQYISLTMRDKPGEILVRFLPFSHQVTINSIKLTLDIPSIFPTVGQVKVIQTQSFSIPSKFSFWNVTPFMYEPLNFPANCENIIVTKVWDGIGDCKEVSQIIDIRRLDENTQGNYYVDYEGKKIAVYPRCHFTGDFYEYSIGAEFLIPPEHDDLDLKSVVNVPPSPYTFRSYISFILSTPLTQNICLSENFEIKFILPTGTEIYCPEKTFTVGLDSTRPFAVFVYNAPKELPPEQWCIQYDLVPLRTFFWVAIISIIILLVFLGVVLKLPYSKSISLIELGLAGAVLIPLNITNLINLGGTTLNFTALFAANIVVYGLIVLVCFFKHSVQITKYERRNRWRSKRN